MQTTHADEYHFTADYQCRNLLDELVLEKVELGIIYTTAKLNE